MFAKAYPHLVVFELS